MSSSTQARSASECFFSRAPRLRFELIVLTAAAIFFAGAGRVAAQSYVEPLPAVDGAVDFYGAPAEEPPWLPGVAASQAPQRTRASQAAWNMSDQDVLQPVVPGNNPASEHIVVPSRPGRTKPSAGKPGILQQVSASETWLPASDSGFGSNDVSTQIVLGFPFPTRETPLLFSPGYEVHYLDGPLTPDMPAQLHDINLQFRHLRKLTDTLGLDVAITPSWHGDLESGAGTTFRIPARIITAYDWSDQTQLVAGLAYLDREDVDFLPVGGIIWKPNDDLRVEAIVPRPRIARRFACEGPVEAWFYMAGEYGGGSYGIRRASGTPDVATLSDLRAMIGLERRNSEGLSAFWEVGYIFGREIDYQSATPTFEPDDTVMLRGGLWY